ncbi:MAG: peroxiredoxin [Rhizomicrobium sp.]
MIKLWAVLLLMGVATPAFAALKVGDAAPDFTAPATLGGKEFTFHLKAALSKGPVVVYFYPAAFTKGCTIEAHDFAEAMPDYRAAGASVIGVSHDDIATLNKFSVSECQSKFPVAADRDRSIMKGYDAALGFLTPYADRTSYVVTQDGKIAFVYSSLNPDQHVAGTLKAVRALSKTN